MKQMKLIVEYWSDGRWNYTQDAADEAEGDRVIETLKPTGVPLRLIAVLRSTV